ncbi:unnamed protein product [Owenia fusiformis]|uniref:Uncharacterized protein n=1 Tax=Owenia fusiformis TaxID=6347 RepID=A0A8J1TT26_OWEFU|nr:unnamed protein product [Owenia fusiformis]
MSLQAGDEDSMSLDSENEKLGLLSGTSTTIISPSNTTNRVGTSWYASVFIVVNAALGAGLLNFPKAYNDAGGVLIAIIVQIVLMVFIIGALIILAYCSDSNQSATYQDVIYSMCGRQAQICCSLAILIYCFGTCITFFIIIGDQWDRFLTFAYGADYCHYWYMSRTFTMIVSSVILILPLCFPKRIDFLKYASIAGVFAVVYVVILITVKYFVGENHPGPIASEPKHWTSVFLVVPVICFGYQCHVSVVPIYSCLKHRSVGEFLKTVIVAMGICFATYTGSAVFGYWTFGSYVNADILVSYKPTPDVLVGIILIAGKIYTTYPILLFCERAAFESVWIEVRSLTPDMVLSGEKKRRYIQTISLFSTSLALAVFIPDIGVVISMLGALAGVFIFIFPGMCLLQALLTQPIGVAWKRNILYALAFGFIVIGTFIFGLVLTQAIIEDVLHPESSSKKSHSLCQ